MKRTSCLLAATLFTTLAACDNSNDKRHKTLAFIPHVGTPNLIAPDTVVVGVPFEVTAIGWGSGSRACNEPAGTHVDYQPGLARIEAYMTYPTGDVICTADLRSYPQTATVTLMNIGNSRIRLIGLSSAQSVAALDSVEKLVIVRAGQQMIGNKTLDSTR